MNSECPCLITTQQLIVHRFIRIHFLNLSDGSPYCTPPSNIIIWEFPRGVNDVSIQELVVTSSRVMMHVYHWEVVQHEDFRVGRILVWDWKTGDLVRLTQLV